MPNVELKMTLAEAVSIVNLLGSLPTSQGAWPLFEKLKAQVEPLVPKAEESSAALDSK
jgi:hypothetical protein